MPMAVSDIETQDLLKSIDAKLCSIVTIMAKNANVAENGKNAQDPYAEQRKWVGKLCRFWDDNSKITKHLGILTRIDETAIVPYEAENGFWYCACEPVKPDSELIYHGE